MIYQQDYTIQSLLCDRTDHLSMWGLARLLQDVAERHTVLTHIGYGDLMRHNKVWVLVRMLYEVRQLPVMDQQVVLKTWSRGCDGLQCWREFQVVDAEGRVMVGATAVWVVIDYSSRRLCRMNDIMDRYEHHPMMATSVEKLERLRMPQQDDLFQKEIPVTESMIDHNRHVNNAEYLRLLFDNMVPEKVGEHAPHEDFRLQIEYLNEVRPEECVTLSRLASGSRYWFEIKTPRNRSFVARLVTEASSDR